MIGDVQQSIDSQNVTNEDYKYKLRCQRTLKEKLSTKASEVEEQVDAEIESLKMEIRELS